MYLFEVGSVSCLTPRLLDNGLGIRQCVLYMIAIIPCNLSCASCSGQRQCRIRGKPLAASTIVFLNLEDHGSEEDEKLPDHACR